MEKDFGKSCWELIGQGEAEFTAGHLRMQGGGRSFGRAIKSIWAKAKLLGQTPANQRGRPLQINLNFCSNGLKGIQKGS